MSETNKFSLLVYTEDGRAHFNCRLLDCIKNHRNDEAFEMLKNNFNSIHARDSDGKTLLHHAADPDNSTIVSYLIKKGADVNAKDRQGKTPLMSVPNFRPSFYQWGMYSHYSVCVFLLRANANIHLLESEGKSIFERFIHTPYYQLFLEKLRDEYCGDVDRIAKKLIEAKCSIYSAVSLKNSDITRRLLEHDCPLNLPGFSYTIEDIFVQCVKNTDLKNVELFLDHGVRANAENLKGETALSVCAYNNCTLWPRESERNLELLQLLLARGADPTVIEKEDFYEGKMQMYSLLTCSTKKTIRILLENNLDFGAKDKRGCTAVHYLAEAQHENVIDLLKNRIIDVNARDNNGRTPLHYITRTNMKIAKFFIDSGADINAKDHKGMTPLMKLWNEWHVYSSFEGLKGIFEKFQRTNEYFLHHGADVQIIRPDNEFSIFSDLFSDVYRSSEIYCMESVLAHLALIEARGTSIKGCIRKKIEANDELKTLYDMCKSELEQMNQVKVTKSISLYEILINNQTKTTELYVQNEKLLLNLRRLENKNKCTPYYQYVLRDNLVKAKNRVRRKRATAAVLSDLMRLPSDHIVIHETLKYLSDVDLQRIHL